MIFLSHFLALLIKADTAEEGRRSFLGSVMVAINVLLILAVLFASCLTTQQTVGDHLAGENVVTVAGTMLTFEELTATKTRFTHEEAAAPMTSIRNRGGSNDWVDSFNRGSGFSACVGPRLPHEARVGGTTRMSVSGPTIEVVAHTTDGRRIDVVGVS